MLVIEEGKFSSNIGKMSKVGEVRGGEDISGVVMVVCLWLHFTGIRGKQPSCGVGSTAVFLAHLLSSPVYSALINASSLLHIHTFLQIQSHGQTHSLHSVCIHPKGQGRRGPRGQHRGRGRAWPSPLPAQSGPRPPPAGGSAEGRTIMRSLYRTCLQVCEHTYLRNW